VYLFACSTIWEGLRRSQLVLVFQRNGSTERPWRPAYSEWLQPFQSRASTWTQRPSFDSSAIRPQVEIR